MIIIGFLLAQVVTTVPADIPIATVTRTQSLEIPTVIREAVAPYLGCMNAGANGRTITSGAQARELNDLNLAQCASIRVRSREAAIELMKRKSRLSEQDIQIFVEAILNAVDDFSDPTDVWQNQ